jgi:hypothetical protein
MFATLLMIYRNYEKWAGLNTQGRLHQQPRKDPVNKLSIVWCSLYQFLQSPYAVNICVCVLYCLVPRLDKKRIQKEKHNLCSYV